MAIRCRANAGWPFNGPEGNRLPAELSMPLMHLLRMSSLHEDTIPRGRCILADPMQFLLASVPRHSRMHGCERRRVGVADPSCSAMTPSTYSGIKRHAPFVSCISSRPRLSKPEWSAGDML